MLTLEEEIKQAIRFFGVVDTATLRRKLSMRRNFGGEFAPVLLDDIKRALKNLKKSHVIRKATGVTDGWALVNP